MRKYVIVLLMLLCGLATAAGQIIWKKGSAEITSITSFLLNKFVIIGFILYALASVTYIIALKHAELSRVFPMISLSFVWVTLYAAIVLQEKLQTSSIIGLVAILAGITLLGVEQ